MTTTKRSNLSTSQGACVFCNTVRRVDEVLCPACGRGWIDASAADSGASVARAEAAAIRTIATGKAPRVRRSTYRKAWWAPLVVASVVFGAYWLIVTLAGSDDTTTSDTLMVTTTASPTTTSALQTPPTTLSPTGTPTTTVAPATTTTTAPEPATTTTTVEPGLPAGDPIALDELRLGAIELGPLPFGSAITDVLPRLVGTFGQPTAYGVAGEEWGLCGGDSGRVITFGGLHIVTVDTDAGETFAGFVLERAGTASDQLLTFSSVGLGATLAQLNDTYRSFDVTIGDQDTAWIVSSFNDGHTLLWGNAKGTGPDAVVDRISSPRACDGGPAAS